RRAGAGRPVRRASPRRRPAPTGGGAPGGSTPAGSRRAPLGGHDRGAGGGAGRMIGRQVEGDGGGRAAVARQGVEVAPARGQLVVGKLVEVDHEPPRIANTSVWCLVEIGGQCFLYGAAVHSVENVLDMERDEGGGDRIGNPKLQLRDMKTLESVDD